MNSTETLKTLNSIIKKAHPDWTSTQIYEETGRLYKAGLRPAENNNDDTADLIMRKDREAYGDRIVHQILFCRHCDPKAEGCHGGIIYSSTILTDIAETAKQHQHYCPTCGRRLNWENPIETVWGRWC